MELAWRGEITGTLLLSSGTKIVGSGVGVVVAGLAPGEATLAVVVLPGVIDALVVVDATVVAATLAAVGITEGVAVLTGLSEQAPSNRPRPSQVTKHHFKAKLCRSNQGLSIWVTSGPKNNNKNARLGLILAETGLKT